MTMLAIARPATPGKWFDCRQKPTRDQLLKLKQEQYIGAIRPVPLPDNVATDDLDQVELGWYLELGLELMVYQHVRTGPWDPSKHSGGKDAMYAKNYLQRIGYPRLAHVWQDLEGVLGGYAGNAIATIDYSVWWASVMLAPTTIPYGAGLYDGYDVPLTPEQLFYKLPHNSYWSDEGHRKVAVRGCAIHQGIQRAIAGLVIDEDSLAPDLLGQVPMACVGAAQFE